MACSVTTPPPAALMEPRSILPLLLITTGVEEFWVMLFTVRAPPLVKVMPPEAPLVALKVGTLPLREIPLPALAVSAP